MNERIKELAEQSEITQCVAAHNKYLERFVELLIRECYEWAKENGGLGTEYDYDALKEHFGVGWMNQTNIMEQPRGFRVYAYKADRRYKSGERLFGKYEFPSYTEEAISKYVANLRSQLYKREDGWRLEYKPLTIQVRNLMSGDLIEIDFEQRGGPCDPSMERYWSM